MCLAQRAIFPLPDVIDNRGCTLEKVKLDCQIVTWLTTPLTLFVVTNDLPEVSNFVITRCILPETRLNRTEDTCLF